MTNQTCGPNVPVDPAVNTSEPAAKKEPRRPVSGYGPSLGSRTQTANRS